MKVVANICKKWMFSRSCAFVLIWMYVIIHLVVKQLMNIWFIVKRKLMLMPICCSKHSSGAEPELWHGSVCCPYAWQGIISSFLCWMWQKTQKRATVSEQPSPLIPSAPVELLSSLVVLGSSHRRTMRHCVNVKQGDAETQSVFSVKPLWMGKEWRKTAWDRHYTEQTQRMSNRVMVRLV